MPRETSGLSVGQIHAAVTEVVVDLPDVHLSHDQLSHDLRPSEPRTSLIIAPPPAPADDELPAVPLEGNWQTMHFERTSQALPHAKAGIPAQQLERTGAAPGCPPLMEMLCARGRAQSRAQSRAARRRQGSLHRRTALQQTASCLLLHLSSRG